MRISIFLIVIFVLFFGCASQQNNESKNIEPVNSSFSITVNENLSIEMVYRHLLVYGRARTENLALSENGVISGKIAVSNFIISKVNNALLFEFTNPITPKDKDYFLEIIKIAEERVKLQIARDDKLFKINISSKNDIRGKINIQKMTIYETDLFSIILRKDEIPNIPTEYTMIYFYNSSNYPYIENIQVKIDDVIYTCNISNQVRGELLNVLPIEESSIILTDEMVKKLKICTSLTVQANGRNRGSPITINARGISNINTFFQ